MSGGRLSLILLNPGPALLSYFHWITAEVLQILKSLEAGRGRLPDFSEPYAWVPFIKSTEKTLKATSSLKPEEWWGNLYGIYYLNELEKRGAIRQISSYGRAYYELIT